MMFVPIKIIILYSIFKVKTKHAETEIVPEGLSNYV